MSKDELQKQADAYFKMHPGTKKIYGTTDGQLFLEEIRAKEFVQRKKNIAYYPLTNAAFESTTEKQGVASDTTNAKVESTQEDTTSTGEDTANTQTESANVDNTTSESTQEDTTSTGEDTANTQTESANVDNTTSESTQEDTEA